MNTFIAMSELCETAQSRRTWRRGLSIARVLLVGDNVTSRLTLQTVLRAVGYQVDAVSSAAEALGQLEQQEYELVLSDLSEGSAEADDHLLAHARQRKYRPATAFVRATWCVRQPDDQQPVLIEPQDLPGLLTKVAELISTRATHRAAHLLCCSAN